MPALLGAHHFLHVSRIRVKSLTLKLLMSYIYRVFQKDLNDKNTFSWGIPHSHWSNMAYNTFEHISFIWRAPNYFIIQPLGGCGANHWWEHEARLAGVRLSYWHLQSNEGRSHWAFVSWFLLVNKLGHLHYLWVYLYLILTINK